MHPTPWNAANLPRIPNKSWRRWQSPPHVLVCWFSPNISPSCLTAGALSRAPFQRGCLKPTVPMWNRQPRINEIPHVKHTLTCFLKRSWEAIKHRADVWWETQFRGDARWVCSSDCFSKHLHNENPISVSTSNAYQSNADFHACPRTAPEPRLNEPSAANSPERFQLHGLAQSSQAGQARPPRPFASITLWPRQPC